MYELQEENSTFGYHEYTLIQSPMTCASSSGANSDFPATMSHIQEHEDLPSNFDQKKRKESAH